jgi:tetratricopeptide (TPR) repeat protein
MNTSRIRSVAALIFVLTIAVGLFQTLPAFAQEYKEAFNSGMSAAKAKDFTAAISSFEAAADGAKAEGDAAVERQSRSIIAKIEYNVGRSFMKKEDFDSAIAHFDNGIAQFPSYAKNYLARASSLKKKGDIEGALAQFAETITVAKASSDSKTRRSAESAIHDQYIYFASSALSRNGSRTTKADAAEALQYLEKLQEFVEADSDVYYYMAEVYKTTGEFQKSVEFADKALSIHHGSRTDKAKIYFVKGESLVSIGKVSAAKAAFEKARFGSYKASAQHFIDTLGTN